LEFLESLAGRPGAPLVFDGAIVDLRPAGLVVEATALALRGLVRREDLPGGRWRCEAHRGRFVRDDGRELRLGARLGLVVARVDRARGFVDFLPANLTTEAGRDGCRDTGAPRESRHHGRPAGRQD
jgi:hypothetical protein